MRVDSRHTPELQVQLLRRLQQERRRGGLTTAEVREVAAACGVSERTVWRWVRMGPSQRPEPFKISRQDVDALLDAGGNIAAAWRARAALGSEVPSLRTYQAAFEKQLLPGHRAALLQGERGRRNHEIYLRWEPDHRNQVWEADHKELPVLVLPPRGIQPQKPWVTLFLDGYSRAVMGWALSLRPTAATVLAALRMAIAVDPAEGSLGGVPEMVRVDNGLEFAAGALTTATAVLGCRLWTLPPYAPHLRGKVERYHRTIDESFVAGLPMHTAGPRALDGRLYGPKGAIALEAFVQQFGAWVQTYNSRTPHDALSGETPLERWAGDDTPLRTVADSDLRWLLLAGTRRRILKDGVHFGGLIFVAAELNGRVGQEVEVRYMPHDLRQVELFIDGEWFATAKPQDLLTDQDRDDILRRRRDDARELGRVQRRASRRARQRFAPITSTSGIEDTTTVSRTQARKEGVGDDERMRKLARTDLLGLDEIRDLYRKRGD